MTNYLVFEALTTNNIFLKRVSFIKVTSQNTDSTNPDITPGA